MTVHLRYYQRSDSTLFLFLSIVTAGLDFKADVAGGNLIQYGIVLVISLGSIFYLSQSTGSWPLKSTICLLASLTALIIPLTVAIYRDTSVGDYLRVSLPYLLCVLGTALGISATINGSASVLLKGLFVGSIISTLLTFINGTIELGFDFSTARYQIISPILPLGFALAIVDMRADNGRRHLVSLYLIFSVVLTFLSVTRSTMLELLAIFLIYILFEISYRNTRRFKFGYISSGRRGVPLLIIGAVAAVTGARLLGPSTYERWLARIFSSQEVGFDVTSATRMAEIDSQLQFLGESFSNLFFGAGFGAKYNWSGGWIPELAAVGGEDFVTDSFFEAGHNFWVYSIFSGGLIAGWIVPTLILSGLASGFLAVRRSIYAVENVDFQHSTKAFLALFSIVLVTIGGNPFGSRVSGFYVGSLIGILTFKSLDSSRSAV